ncbi:MAG TPA: hypothetical protein VKI64_04735 [Acidimicrobiales bacterium]|nr:hypothetical protein [Acidimicrobiales bacterium]
MIAAAVATMLVAFLFIAFVVGLRYGWTHSLPAGAVSIEEIGLKTVNGEDSFLLMGHDGWQYAFRDGGKLYLVPRGHEHAT